MLSDSLSWSRTLCDIHDEDNVRRWREKRKADTYDWSNFFSIIEAQERGIEIPGVALVMNDGEIVWGTPTGPYWINCQIHDTDILVNVKWAQTREAMVSGKLIYMSPEAREIVPETFGDPRNNDVVEV